MLVGWRSGEAAREKSLDCSHFVSEKRIKVKGKNDEERESVENLKERRLEILFQ